VRDFLAALGKAITLGLSTLPANVGRFKPMLGAIRQRWFFITYAGRF